MDVSWEGSSLRIRLHEEQKEVDQQVKFQCKVNNKEVPIYLAKEIATKKESEPYSTFQIIPHSGIKNNKTEQFADALADTYEELYERWNSGLLSEPERVFFETEITNKSFKTYVTTNTHIKDAIKQQSQLTWKNITIQDKKPRPLNHEKCLCYNFKLKFPFFLSLKTDRTMQQIPLEELLEISRFMQRSDRVFIQFGFQAAEEHWYKDAEKQRDDFEKKPPKQWVRKGVSFNKPTELKTAHIGFDFVLRVIVQSNDERRKRRIARGVSLALKQLNQDNELIDKMIKPNKTKRFIEDVERHHIPVPFIFGKRQILTPPEIAHFIKFPQRALQDEYPIVQTITGRETEIPDNLKRGGFELGKVTFKGKKHPIYMPKTNFDELCLPRVVIGGMGSGKTKGFGANWMVNAVNNGFGSLAIDPAKGEIGDELQSSLPTEKLKRIRLGQLPISLDWCEVEHSSRAKNRLANTIIGFFNNATDETGAQTARFIRAAVMAMRTGKLSEIIRILEDKEYRDILLCPKHGVREQMNHMHISTLEDLNKMTEGKRAQILAPIYNRLDTILGDQYLSECMDSDESLDMVQLMSERKAYVIDVPKSELGPEAVNLIVNLLSTKIDLAMTLRKENNQFPFFVVFDEPHQFLKSAKTWKSAAVESRKWRVGYVWMFHSWEQIPRDLAEIIKSAGPHYHLYPSSKKTFADLSEEISPITVEEALKLKKYHAINILRAGETGVNKPIIARMSLPPSIKKGLHR